MALYRDERNAGGDFDAGIRAGLARILTSPSFLFRSEQDPRGARRRRGASGQRARSGEPAVVLPVEQHPGRRAAEPGDRGPAACARRARSAGAAHDCRPARRRADERRSPASGCSSAIWTRSRRTCCCSPTSTTTSVRRSAARPSCSSPASSARTDQRSTLLDADYTFVNERLAQHYGIPNVYGSRFRRVPVTDPNRRGLLGQGSILSMTVGGQSHVAGAAREVHHLEPAEHAAAAAAGRRAGSRGERAQGSAVDGARAARTASREPGVRLVPSQHRSGGLRARELRRRRAVADRRRGKGWRSTRPACSPMARRSTDRWRCARRCCRRPDVFVGTVTEKLLIYALGRGLEPVDMPVVREHRQERRCAELRHAVDRARNRPERSVPDADEP